MGEIMKGGLLCTCGRIPHDRGCELPRSQERAKSSALRAVRALEARALGLGRWRGAADAIAWYVAQRLRRTSPRCLPADPSAGGGGYDPHRAEIVERQYAAVVDALRVAEVDDRELHPERPAPLAEWSFLHFVRDRDRRPIGKTCAWIAEWGPRLGWPGWTEREISNRIHRTCRVVRERLKAGGWLVERVQPDAGERE